VNHKLTLRLLIGVALALVLLSVGVPWVYGQDTSPPAQPAAPDNPSPSTHPVMAPLGTAFTYQGELQDQGRPANGAYDFSFRLLDGADPGTASQVGSPVAVDNVDVSDGIFTVELDFGAGPFSGEARWLEISVARHGGTLITLAPPQPLTPVPTALYAQYGEDADADPANELNTAINFTGTTLQITDGGGTLSQDLGTFNGNLVISTNGRLGVREPAPITDMQITQSDGLIAGTGGLTFSRSTNWKIMHTGSHLSFVENNVRRAYIETGTGNYVTVSDQRKKKDLAPLGAVLPKVLRLDPVQFHYLGQGSSAAKNYGFIAQDVAAVFPELARTAEDGEMGLAYAAFGVLAIASIQEQQAQIEALQSENQALRAEIDEIKAMLSQGNASAAGMTRTASPSAASLAGGQEAAAAFSWPNLAVLGLALLSAWLLWSRKQQGGAK
jgi:hypothetical protein